MFQKFFSNLSGPQRVAVSILLIVGIVGLFYQLVYRSTQAKLASIDEEIAKEKKLIQSELAVIERKDAIQSDSQSYQAFYTNQVASKNEVIAQFLKNLGQLAAQAEITISKITPTGEDELDEGYLKFFAEVECTGSLKNVTRFFHLIDTSDELIRVDEFTLGAGRGESEDVRASVTVAKMIAGSNPSQDMRKLIKKGESAPADAM